MALVHRRGENSELDLCDLPKSQFGDGHLLRCGSIDGGFTDDYVDKLVKD